MEPESMTRMLCLHLERNQLSNGEARTWTVQKSPLGGRGLFAVRDIAVGELLYVDAPLVVGPRAQSKHLPLCPGCYKTGCPLFPCDRGCGLPICSTVCESSSTHQNECSILKSWKPTCGSSWSMDLLRALVPIRALSLDNQQRELINFFQSNSWPQRTSELDILKKNIEIQPEKNEEEFMARVCSVMDTNACETAAFVGKSVTSLRGLYPMIALQNHSCRPNTRHYYNSEQILYVLATVPIKKGDEITMTYTDLFWDTKLRRGHLAATKHFFCNCSRCADPLENGSLLGALRCASDRCTGNLLAIQPLNDETPWKCTECGLIMKNRQINSIRSGLSSIVEEVTYKNPRQMMKFIKNELSILVPATNYLMVEMKLRIISSLGKTDKFLWPDLTRDDLTIKEKYCRDLLSLIKTLKWGECKMKGLISYELYRSLEERDGREKRLIQQFELKGDDEKQNLLTTAVLILKNDVTAPENLPTVISVTEKAKEVDFNQA
ncbi:SET domain-containing protein SmydA-8-like [Athalia rosae]|uniref:SET domain-containing protein SmydA-8-like n=1 Tax=Athalia rosae TaxID=37344 RepID=UPI00203428D7|nr:SET domain-containing protein SmydA-8-like [Athalia rosae]